MAGAANGAMTLAEALTEGAHAGHDAAAGEKVTVELGRPVHLLTAAGAIARGAQVEAAGNGRVRTATEGTVIGTALTAAADGAAVEILA